MKKLAIVVVLALIAGGAWAFLHQDKASKMVNQAENAASQAASNPSEAARELLSDADRARYVAQLAAAQQKSKMLKMWLAACQNHNAPTMDHAYDGFNYDKADEYKTAEDAQEARIKDLQSRLNGAYGR
jgi:hypothetical protein